MSEVMTAAEQWRRVQDLCDALEGVPDAEIAGRLDALESDTAVRCEVLAILAALRDEATFPPASPRPPLVAAQPTEIGGVRIASRLGAGGSGEVFRGVRVVNGVEQPVAVKRFHAHRATASDLGRFAREQRLLAGLTHPDIVRLFDAGATDDGRPFLVMELVEGDPITAACDEQRLPVRARLELFLAVCAAVQSAHQHLVVHLDLKPSNILITSERRPKLLDFGTAKLTGPDVGLTVTEPLTLQYASPERLRREPVSVACDVYSLGLVLYELVSGGWPFGRHESIVAVAERASGLLDATPLSRVVTEDAAHRRSTSLERLRSDLRGDLEAIVARTLAHDPAARYATVAELAADIQRYLDGELVLARTPGLGYRLGKFVTRHRWEVASVVVVILALVGAATYSTVQARAARAAAERAQAQNRFLTSLFTLAGNDATSASGMTVRELLALADQRVSPLLTSQPDVAGDVERTLAQGLLAHGALDDAEALAARARGRAADLGDAPREAAARALLSYLRYARSRPAEAMDEARAALRMWREHRASFDADLEAYTLMTASSTLAYANPPSAEPSEYLEACLARTDDTATAMRYTVRQGCLFLLAAVRVNAEERFADAEILLIEAVALQRADPTLRSQLVNSLQLLGIVQRVTGAVRRGRSHSTRSVRDPRAASGRRQHRCALAARGVGHEPRRGRPCRRRLSRGDGCSGPSAAPLPRARHEPVVDAAVGGVDCGLLPGATRRMRGAFRRGAGDARARSAAKRRTSAHGPRPARPRAGAPRSLRRGAADDPGRRGRHAEEPAHLDLHGAVASGTRKRREVIHCAPRSLTPAGRATPAARRLPVRPWRRPGAAVGRPVGRGGTPASPTLCPPACGTSGPPRLRA
jgi:hypothetical protein